MAVAIAVAAITAVVVAVATIRATPVALSGLAKLSRELLVCSRPFLLDVAAIVVAALQRSLLACASSQRRHSRSS
jgi:hypothetical protein